MASDKSSKSNITSSLYAPQGVSGLPRFAGYVYDEFLPELQGPRGRRVLREFSDNDAIVGACLLAIEQLIRQVGWSVAPGTDDAEGEDLATFIDQAIHDMETSWEDVLADILSMLVYGWSLFELVYKRRDGKCSKFSDGRIGWQGWQMRGQETLLRWGYADMHANFPESFIQLGPPDYQMHEIPMSKCLLFRTTTRRANPEGRPIIRNAYRSWFMKKNIETIEGIGIERDLAGLPIMLVPSQLLSADASPQEQAQNAALQRIIQNIRRDEQEGVLMPSDRDERGNLLYELKLLSTGGTRQFDTDRIIARYDQRISMTVLADWLILGHENVGSQSLGQTKASMFTTALGGWLATICAQINDVAIPRLLSLNGIAVEHPPQLEHGQVERQDLDVLGAFLYNLGQAGFVFDTDPQGSLMRHLLEQAHLPDPPEGLTVPFHDQYLTDEWGQPISPNYALTPKRTPPAAAPPDMPTTPPAAAGQAGQPAAVARRSGAARKTAAERKMRWAGKTVRRLPVRIAAHEPMPEPAGLRLFKEHGIDLQKLKVVAFDLDDTALLYPKLLAPLAEMLAAGGVEIGVLTGNASPEAALAWAKDYPHPDFYESHGTLSSIKLGRWKAEQCEKHDVDVLIDDFHHGQTLRAFRAEVARRGLKVLPLQVVLPPDAPKQHVGKQGTEPDAVIGDPVAAGTQILSSAFARLMDEVEGVTSAAR